MQKEGQVLTAISFMLGYCFFATATDALVKFLGIEGISASQILFLRSFVGAIILLPIMLKKPEPLIIKANLKLNSARALCSFCAALIWFYILEFVDFTKIMAVGFSSTLFTVILAIIFFKEKATPQKIICLLIGFSGAMVVIQPGSINFDFYLLFGLCSSFIWAVSLLIAKKLSNRESSLHMAFTLTILWIPLSLGFAIKNWQWLNIEQSIVVIVMTIFASLGQIFLAKSFSKADLSSLMPFEFSILIFASLFSYFLFSQIIGFWTIVGGSMILFSSYWIISHEKKKGKTFEEGKDVIF